MTAPVFKEGEVLDIHCVAATIAGHDSLVGATVDPVDLELLRFAKRWWLLWIGYSLLYNTPNIADLKHEQILLFDELWVEIIRTAGSEQRWRQFIDWAVATADAADGVQFDPPLHWPSDEEIDNPHAFD